MNIAVAHHSLNFLGGAEKLCLGTVEALKLAGHEITLVTAEETDWKAVRRIFGKVIMPDHETYLLKIKLSKQSSFAAIFMLFAVFITELFLLKIRRKHDLVINTYGNLLDFMSDIAYVHFPLARAQTPPIMNTMEWLFLRQVYSLVTGLFSIANRGVVLVNSTFTKELVEGFLHRNTIVVYPPVEVKECLSLAKNQKRENFVVTISKYSPKRHLENVPLIAKHVKSANFIIIGNADKTSLTTFRKLKRLIDILELRNQVKLLTNVPRPMLFDLLSRSKVYLHAMPYERFGIAVVEAMATGCVPIVHRSGGPWLDMLDQKQGKYGYAYGSPQEAAKYITLLLSSENLRERLASLSLERSLMYDKSVFGRKMVKVVEAFYSGKRLGIGKKNESI